MGILVVQVANDYGSTQDKEIAVPLTIDPTNSNHPPPSPSKQTTMWKVACILGLTAVTLVSRAVLFVSQRKSSAVLQAATHNDEAFLLRRKDGTCVAQSGAWPANNVTTDDDEMALSGPLSTCFAFLVGPDPTSTRTVIGNRTNLKGTAVVDGLNLNQKKLMNLVIIGKGYYSGYK